MVKLIPLAERLFLIALAVGIIARLLPHIQEHPQLLLFLVSEVVGVVLLLFQRRGSWTDKGFPLLIAFIGTGVGLLVQPVGAKLVPDFASALLIFLGATISLAAKLSLNRSFGIVPANRGVKSGGVYRLVRHPMYLGYMVNQLGYFLIYASVFNFCVYAAAWTAFLLRVREEEKFLLADAAYRSYASRVRSRLVPGVI